MRRWLGGGGQPIPGGAPCGEGQIRPVQRYAGNFVNRLVSGYIAGEVAARLDG